MGNPFILGLWRSTSNLKRQKTIWLFAKSLPSKIIIVCLANEISFDKVIIITLFFCIKVYVKISPNLFLLKKGFND